MSQQVKDSLVKYDSPILVSEKLQSKVDKNQKNVPRVKKSTGPIPKQLPPVDPTKSPASQVEDILNNIVAAK
jgi:hypothetical protein